MKFGIDTFGLDHGRSGLGSYLFSLMPFLPDCDGLEYELFGAEIDRYTYTDKKDCPFYSANVPDSLAAERFWHSFRANSFAKKRGYSAVLYTAGSRMIPSSFKVPGVAVVNDIVSSLFEQKGDRWYSSKVRKGLSRANCIIAASKFIKKDLEKTGIKANRIEIIHNGIDHSLFFPKAAVGGDSEIIDIKPFAIKKPYIIYASRMQNEEKKHVELIRAFSVFKKKTKSPVRLVIAGSEESSYGAKVHAAALESGFASDIFITGYFPHENFPELFRNAEACVFPSVNEGVGLSVMEAMATGLPVACAKSGALPEVTGGNALYFDSDNIEEMSCAIETILSDAELRKKLVADGIEWTRRVSWERTAQETVNVLKSLC